MQQINQIDQTPFSNQFTNILFLSDLTPLITEDDIRQFFKFYSEKIKQISINHKTKKSPNATIIFENQKIAEIAKRNLNMQKLKGKTVRIMCYLKEKEILENFNTNIYIKNISIYATPRQVFEHFLKFGEIISCKIPENDAGDHLGYGYINYMTAESAKNAIDSENGKKIWNNILEVMPFKNTKIRNEESLKNSNLYNNNINPMYPMNPINNFISNNYFNCVLYIHDFPQNFTEENLLEIFTKNNLDTKEIKTLKIVKNINPINPINTNNNNNNNNLPYAVLVFSDEKTTIHFKLILQKIEIEGKSLRIENDKKSDSCINNNNNTIKNLSNKCNLIIKNIPYDADENDLTNSFEKFGQIKSVKIERINLVTKLNDEYVEKKTSQGFGYICFSNNEEALNAKENMDGKYLQKFEMWKRPLIIDYFVPKGQRKNYNYNYNNSNNYQGEYFQNQIQTPPQIPNSYYMQSLSKEFENIDLNNFNKYNNNNINFPLNLNQPPQQNLNYNIPQQNQNQRGFNNNNNKINRNNQYQHPHPNQQLAHHQNPQNSINNNMNIPNNFMPTQQMMNMNMNMNQQYPIYNQNPQNNMFSK
jgi:RNA recognition motif-containing protein